MLHCVLISLLVCVQMSVIVVVLTSSPHCCDPEFGHHYQRGIILTQNASLCLAPVRIMTCMKRTQQRTKGQRSCRWWSCFNVTLCRWPRTHPQLLTHLMWAIDWHTALLEMVQEVTRWSLTPSNSPPVAVVTAPTSLQEDPVNIFPVPQRPVHHHSFQVTLSTPLHIFEKSFEELSPRLPAGVAEKCGKCASWAFGIIKNISYI